jgi:hypothetical protein
MNKLVKYVFVILLLFILVALFFPIKYSYDDYGKNDSRSFVPCRPTGGCGLGCMGFLVKKSCSINEYRKECLDCEALCFGFKYNSCIGISNSFINKFGLFPREL